MCYKSTLFTFLDFITSIYNNPNSEPVSFLLRPLGGSVAPVCHWLSGRFNGRVRAWKVIEVVVRLLLMGVCVGGQ